MDRLSDSFNQKVFHKKKEPKKKQIAKGLIANSQLDNRTDKGSTQKDNSQMSVITEVNRQSDNKTDIAARTRRQMKNLEIDEYLEQLLIEELISEKFIPYYAKACHTLGISKINSIVISVREVSATPAKLLAYKVKGAMSLYYKREYYKSKMLEDTGKET